MTDERRKAKDRLKLLETNSNLNLHRYNKGEITHEQYYTRRLDVSRAITELKSELRTIK